MHHDDKCNFKKKKNKRISLFNKKGPGQEKKCRQELFLQYLQSQPRRVGVEREGRGWGWDTKQMKFKRRENYNKNNKWRDDKERKNTADSGVG